jgi:GNAT superfamily N-acetyltransferase
MANASFCSIEFTLEISKSDDEPSDYISIYDGHINAKVSSRTNWDIDVRKVGKIQIYIIERSRSEDDGEPIFDVMDSLTSDSFDCFETLFDQKTNDYQEKVKKLQDENRIFMPDMMLINRVEIDPEYRGKGIAKEAVLRVIKKLGTSCDLITCKPFPIQYSRTAKDHPVAFRAARTKVREFWKKVGFVRVPATDYYVWPD